MIKTSSLRKTAIKLICLSLAIVIVSTIGALPASAKIIDRGTTSKFIKYKNGYQYVKLTCDFTGATYERIDTPGIRKRSYTTGSISVSKAQSETFEMSTKISGTYNYGFAQVGAEFGISASATKSISKGTVIQIEKNAPNGVYYGYYVVPQRSVKMQAQTCSLNHTNWSKIYKKSISYAPVKRDIYLDARMM